MSALTPENAFGAPTTIENSEGTKIQVFPGTKIFCRQDNLSNDVWFLAREVRNGFLAPTISHKSARVVTSFSKVCVEDSKQLSFQVEFPQLVNEPFDALGWSPIMIWRAYQNHIIINSALGCLEINLLI